LPNIVKKLIEEFTDKDDLVADLFAGCGTTLVEAKIHGRKSVGVDINPVAQLITKAKTIPVEPILLNAEFERIEGLILTFDPEAFQLNYFHERIDYWFELGNKRKIAFLYSLIIGIESSNIRNFYLCALSNILKNCSRWLQSGTKPQIDPDKVPSEVFAAFKVQVKSMLKKNKAFYEELQKLNYLNIDCEIFLEDARSTSIKSDSVAAIITSPPYVTSYEYADIHQLTGFWYDYIQNLQEFRRNFIGTFYSLNQDTNTFSFIGQEIVDELLLKDKRYAKEVANYFNDMHNVAKEMRRVLKPDGHVCMVIGNTTFQDVRIKSAEVFSEILVSLGFELVNIIKRSIPHKIMPTIRDSKTGQFTKLSNKNGKMVYPDEYILIAKK
jgi:DNA modification methylase